MTQIGRNFVLRHTFENANIPDAKSSPTKNVFGYEWFFSINQKDGYFQVHLSSKASKSHVSTPVTVRFRAILHSIDEKEHIEEESTETYMGNYSWGFEKLTEWKTIEEKYLEDGKVTVEVHVEVLKVFEVPKIDRKFVLQNTIKNATALNSEKSPIENHFGVNWNLLIEKANDDLHVQLHCHHNLDSSLWGIDLQYVVKVKSVNDGVADLKWSGALTFDSVRSVGYRTSIAWKKIEEYCITNDTFKVEVLVTIHEMRGIYQTKKVDFCNEKEILKDTCLIVNGKKFYASMTMLSLSSSVFKYQFYNVASIFDNPSDVVIEDTDSKSFEVFLGIIYSYKPTITSGNVEKLLNLADRYDVPRVTRKCLKFLLNANDIDVKRKLELADHFMLPELEKHALESLKTSEEVKALCGKMKGMSVMTANALLAKAMSFVN